MTGCGQDQCPAAAVADGHCLEHASEQSLELEARAWESGAPLDARGGRISAEAIDRLLAVLSARNAPKDPIPFMSGRRGPSELRFEGAEFVGPVDFSGIHFRGPALFDGAIFCEIAKFDSATFEDHADFDNVQFLVPATFDQTTERRGVILNGLPVPPQGGGLVAVPGAVSDHPFVGSRQAGDSGFVQRPLGRCSERSEINPRVLRRPPKTARHSYGSRSS